MRTKYDDYRLLSNLNRFEYLIALLYNTNLIINNFTDHTQMTFILIEYVLNLFYEKLK